MKSIKILLFALMISAFSNAQQDYIININGQEMDIELDREYPVQINGKEVNFFISAKDTLIYEDEIFSFMYPKEYKISRLELEDGITQFAVINGEGSGYMIQKYTNMSPLMLNEMMLNELTKESLNYGFKLERQDYSRTLKGGTEVKVNKAVLNYKDETNIYEIMSAGKKDEGILVVTMAMDDNLSAESEKLLTMLWESLRLQ